MLGMVVVSGDWKKGVSAIVNVMHDIEVGGLSLETAMDSAVCGERRAVEVQLPEIPPEACVSGEASGQATRVRLARTSRSSTSAIGSRGQSGRPRVRTLNSSLVRRWRGCEESVMRRSLGRPRLVPLGLRSQFTIRIGEGRRYALQHKAEGAWCYPWESVRVAPNHRGKANQAK